MPEMQINAFKRAIAQGKLQIGLWSSLCSNIAAEVISDSGFDWILLDTEHSPNEIPDLVTQLQAIQRGTATPIIRPAWNDAVVPGVSHLSRPESFRQRNDTCQIICTSSDLI